MKQDRVFSRILFLLGILNLASLPFSCGRRELATPAAHISSWGFNSGRVVILHKISYDRGSQPLEVLYISIKDDKGNELPLLSSTMGLGKGYTWSWIVGFAEPQASKVRMEARVTFGCGEYQIVSVMRKKPLKEWYKYDGYTTNRGLELTHGWTGVSEESSARWIPPKKGNKSRG